jgi:hypothetical protein
MEKTKKLSDKPLKGLYTVIARKVGCSPKYVNMVLNEQLGKYTDRDTELVKKIRETAVELKKIFESES